VVFATGPTEEEEEEEEEEAPTIAPTAKPSQHRTS